MEQVEKILIVDDEPHIRRILQFLLENEGFQVCLATHGQEALDLLKTEKVDLILLDVMMPHMDGFTVLQHIRDQFETRRVPVIMLTAKGKSTEKVRGLRGGANDYMTKPFNQEELLLRMRNMLEANRAEREANPLTGLPGNRAIERECQARMARGEPYGFMYIDIDRFKGFNDYYGYSRGDKAISFVAKVLCDSSRVAGAPSDFIGHVGGDDFIVITDTTHAETLATQIIASFDEGVSVLHDPKDFENGYLSVRNRSGQLEQVPLITLTIALVVDALGKFQHPAQLSDVAAELKRYGKANEGSVVVKERRSPDGSPELVTHIASAQKPS